MPHFDHERTGPDDRRDKVDCPSGGCTPVVVIGSKLTWLITAIVFFGSTISGLLIDQSYRKIPAVEKTINDQNNANDKRMTAIEVHQKEQDGRIEDGERSIGSLEESVYTNRVAIKRVSRPVNTTIRRQEIYVIPAKPTATLPPADRHEIWRQK